MGGFNAIVMEVRTVVSFHKRISFVTLIRKLIPKKLKVFYKQRFLEFIVFASIVLCI